MYPAHSHGAHEERGMGWHSRRGKSRGSATRKGYGFLSTVERKDVFCHYSAIQNDGSKALKEGDPVQFDVVQGITVRRLQTSSSLTSSSLQGQAAQGHSHSHVAIDVHPIRDVVAVEPVRDLPQEHHAIIIAMADHTPNAGKDEVADSTNNSGDGGWAALIVELEVHGNAQGVAP